MLLYKCRTPKFNGTFKSYGLGHISFVWDCWSLWSKQDLYFSQCNCSNKCSLLTRKKSVKCSIYACFAYHFLYYLSALIKITMHGHNKYFDVDITGLQEPYIFSALLQRTLKNYALWKFYSKCIKFGTKPTHFQKKNQSALISAILTDFETNSKIKFCMGRFYFII